MIQINLLPAHLRPIQRTPLPYIVSVALSAAVVAGIVMMFIAQRAHLSGLRLELSSEKKALADLKPIVDEANTLAQKKLALQSRILTIQEILSDRIVWSEQLHRLAALTPENMWLNEISVVMETVTETVIEYDVKTQEALKDLKTGKVKTKKVRVKKPALQVTGYVINDEQGRREVNPIMQNTYDDKGFSANFTLTSPFFEDTEFNGYPVRKFMLPFSISTGDGS